MGAEEEAVGAVVEIEAELLSLQHVRGIAARSGHGPSRASVRQGTLPGRLDSLSCTWVRML